MKAEQKWFAAPPAGRDVTIALDVRQAWVAAFFLNQYSRTNPDCREVIDKLYDATTA